MIPSEKARELCPKSKFSLDMITNSIYEYRLGGFRAPVPVRSIRSMKTKKCPMCSEMIADNDYQYHIDRCNISSPTRDRQQKESKECPMCFKMIDDDIYVDHVHKCIEE